MTIPAAPPNTLQEPSRAAPRLLSATLDHIALGSSDPEALGAFYGRALGLTLERRGEGWWGEGPERRLHFLPGEAKTLAYAAYRVDDRNELERLRARLDAAQWPTTPSPSPRFDEAVALRDPDGNLLVFGLVAEAAARPADGLPARLQHIVVWDPLESTCRHASLSIL